MKKLLALALLVILPILAFAGSNDVDEKLVICKEIENKYSNIDSEDSSGCLSNGDYQIVSENEDSIKYSLFFETLAGKYYECGGLLAKDLSSATVDSCIKCKKKGNKIVCK